MKSASNKYDRINHAISNLEQLYQQMQQSLKHGGLDKSAQDIVASFESHYIRTLNLTTIDPSLESYTNYNDTTVSMERVGQLLAGARDKAKKAAKIIWQKIVAMFNWIRQKIPFFNKKEQKIEEGVEAVKKAANSKGSATSSSFDGGADPMLLVKQNYAVKETESAQFQRRLEFALSNTRYSQEQIENLVKHCKQKRPKDFKEYEVDKFTADIVTDEAKWNRDYYLMCSTYLNHNFSVKRLDHVVEVRRHLVDTGVIKLLDVTKTGKTDKAADKGILPTIKETVDTINGMSDKEKQEVTERINKVNDSKTRQSEYVNYWPTLANGPKSAIVEGLNQAHEAVVKITTDLNYIFAMLLSELHNATKNNNLKLYEPGTKNPVAEIKKIGNTIEEFMNDYCWPHYKIKMPGMTIKRNEVTGPAKDEYLNYQILVHEFRKGNGESGEALIFSLSEAKPIERRHTNKLMEMTKLADEHGKTLVTVNGIIQKYGDSVMSESKEYYKWCYHWALSFSKLYSELYRFHSQATNIHSEITTGALKALLNR